MKASAARDGHAVARHRPQREGRPVLESHGLRVTFQHRSAPFGGLRLGNRIFDSRVITVPVPPAKAFAPIRLLGGKNGWYACDFLWRLRGAMDLALGGVGVRRGRPDRDLRIGDPLDFWRVEAFEPDHLLRLQAEMKLPGRAWLEFIVGDDGGATRLTQTAMFDPSGLGGYLYWYGLYPIHVLIFRGMIRRLGMAAMRDAAKPLRPIGS